VTTAKDLSCQELVELVTEYLEGRLSEVDARRFEEHLEVCAGCRAYLQQMRTVLRAVGTLREDDLEPAAAERLLSAFRDWKSGA
jgi:predicted anti-sigma-YlaC factor YlaD